MLSELFLTHAIRDLSHLYPTRRADRGGGEPLPKMTRTQPIDTSPILKPVNFRALCFHLSPANLHCRQMRPHSERETGFGKGMNGKTPGRGRHCSCDGLSEPSTCQEAASSRQDRRANLIFFFSFAFFLCCWWVVLLWFLLLLPYILYSSVSS